MISMRYQTTVFYLRFCRFIRLCDTWSQEEFDHYKKTIAAVGFTKEVKVKTGIEYRIIKSPCEKCKHAPICKYVVKDSLNDVEVLIKDSLFNKGHYYNDDSLVPIDIVIDCKHYISRK